MRVLTVERLSLKDKIVGVVDSCEWMSAKLNSENLTLAVRTYAQNTITLWLSSHPIALVMEELEKELANRIRKLPDWMLLTKQEDFCCYVLRTLLFEANNRRS